MKTLLHPSSSRGYANHGWLEARHTFSFAGYHNPARTHFGVLRVLNDDIVAGGRGFGTHPHDNMEIVTILLEGAIEHRDSMGTTGIIRAGDVQVMSAGTGVEHSEVNPLPTEATNLLQIWVFTDRLGHTPRYDQRSFAAAGRQGTWQYLVAPDMPGALAIHQQAWFARTELAPGQSLTYTPGRQGNGVYAFLIKGKATLAGETLGPRDGLAIQEATELTATGIERSDLLLLDVPMELPDYLHRAA